MKKRKEDLKVVHEQVKEVVYVKPSPAKRIFSFARTVLLILLIFILMINGATYLIGRNYMITDEQWAVSDFKNSKYDAIVVIGNAESQDYGYEFNNPRLDAAIDAYKKGAADSILVMGYTDVNGDNAETEYMINYLKDNGVPFKSIIKDYNADSVYVGVLRAKNIHGMKRVLVPDYKFRIYRVLFVAIQQDMKVKGLFVEPSNYAKSAAREILETKQRAKDILQCTTARFRDNEEDMEKYGTSGYKKVVPATQQ